MAKNDNLTDFLTDVADAIREKKGTTDKINPQDFSSEIASIQGGSDSEDMFEKIGYTDTDLKGVKEAIQNTIEYSYTVQQSPSKSGLQNTLMFFVPKLNTAISNPVELFKSNASLLYVPQLDISGTTDTSYMFYGCKSLLSVPTMDTSKVTNMGYMFAICSNLREVPLFDTSNVTTLEKCFKSCAKLTSIPPFNTSKVENMIETFSYCESITEGPDIDTSSVTNMQALFQCCYNLETIPAYNTSNVTRMQNMFQQSSKLKYLPALDSQKVTHFGGMFQYGYALTRIECLDFSSITYMSYMLGGCSRLLFALFKNIGKSTLATYDFSGATNWGVESNDIPDARQSLIDSLITYSYDRASNGMSTVTIKLSTNTKNQLTEEEIAQITAKGFTIS